MTTGPNAPTPPPGGPSGPTGPGRTTFAVPPLDWRRGDMGGTWTAVAGGRRYTIGHCESGWWWASVDGRRMADPNGMTAWGIKSQAQTACGEHLAFHRGA